MKINPNILRKKVIDMVVAKQSGHIGGAFSMAELTAVLYEDYDIGGKDKLILSKGHAVPIIYAVLHELGKITDKELDLFREIDSPLQGHPDKLRLPLMDATTGSLGQGLSIAIGHSLGKKLKNEDGTIFCVLGDGELQEGQVWEALMYYPKTNLNNMICIVDWNKGQNDGYSKDFSIMYDNLQERITSFGWDTRLVNGHDMRDIRDVIGQYYLLQLEKPLCIILDTIKGKGVSFMEDPSWHCKVPTEEEYKIAMKELGV
ncbi:transketolase [Candidatus Pacearchaeota archaeon]|nr:transketolase [Candidatus Pacearchaeota archaeon]|tara:strand:+ start:3451 stop:4227 length:777 start_codon:yes stop_codon:yes gene_type:complete